MTFKKIIIALALVAGLIAIVQPHAASALFDNATQEACKGVGLGGGGCTTGGSSLTKLIQTVINIVSAVVGLAAVVMVIVGGFKYITSGGDSGKASTAKSTIVYAIIGLIVAALAQVIVRFVIGTATK